MMKPITAEVEVKTKYNVSINNLIKKRLSLYRAFSLKGLSDEIKMIQEIGQYLVNNTKKLAFYGSTEFFLFFIKHFPHIKSHIHIFIIKKDFKEAVNDFYNIPTTDISNIPEFITDVFICENETYEIWKNKNNLTQPVNMITPDLIQEINWKMIPESAFIPEYDTIYPIKVPEINFQKKLDMILLDCPSRDMAFLPNGLGYVHNILKKTEIKFQTMDLDIIAYHQYHIHRLFDSPEQILTPSGKELPEDPWLAENENYWAQDDTIDYFRSLIDEASLKIVQAKPKILGLSIHLKNIKFAANITKLVKQKLPDITIIIGGYSCYQPLLGLKVFPLADYMVISESELSLPPLIKELLKGNKPKNLPGVISKYDEHQYIPGPILDNIDDIEKPEYDWCEDITIYRNYNHYHLIPILSSRGCRWSRCRFCSERFPYRARNPIKVVDEIEWHTKHGFCNFMFNESDLNGRSEILLQICDEIIKRGLLVRLSGQLRINKKSTAEFFAKLKAAGFTGLRFGVDAWSDNTMKLQNKGYKPRTVSKNLKDCWQSGINVEVNVIIGVPGETEEDIDEMIQLISLNKQYIGRIANINPLILFIGSEYWENIDKFNIKLRGNSNTKEFLSNTSTNTPPFIPVNKWYSEIPYIDEKIRHERLKRFINSLYKNRVNLGPYAKHIVDDIESRKDQARGSIEGNELNSVVNNQKHTLYTTENEKKTIVKINNEFYLLNQNKIFIVNKYNALKNVYLFIKIPMVLFKINAREYGFFNRKTLLQSIIDFGRLFTISTQNISFSKPNIVDKILNKLFHKSGIFTTNIETSLTAKMPAFFNSIQNSSRFFNNIKDFEKNMQKIIWPEFKLNIKNDQLNDIKTDELIHKIKNNPEKLSFNVSKNNNLGVEVLVNNYKNYIIYKLGSIYYANPLGISSDQNKDTSLYKKNLIKGKTIEMVKSKISD